MLKGYQILDADSHVMEPVEMWEEYLEPAFKSFAPKKEQRTIVQTSSSRIIEIDLFEPAFKNLTVSGEKSITRSPMLSGITGEKEDPKIYLNMTIAPTVPNLNSKQWRNWESI